jgi:hypothetical protein
MLVAYPRPVRVRRGSSRAGSPRSPENGPSRNGSPRLPDRGLNLKGRDEGDAKRTRRKSHDDVEEPRGSRHGSLDKRSPSRSRSPKRADRSRSMPRRSVDGTGSTSARSLNDRDYLSYIRSCHFTPATSSAHILTHPLSFLFTARCPYLRCPLAPAKS